MTFLHTVRTSSGLYRTTRDYLATVVVLFAVVDEWIGISAGVIILGLVAVTEILLATWTELRQMHRQVNGQTDRMLDRIDELADLLSQHHIHLPPEGGKVSEARRDVNTDA